jgi:hypothetical protein
MRAIVRRRWLSAMTVLLALAILWAWCDRLDARLFRGSFLSGWTLLASLVALAALNWRKKLPAPPLGDASLWMQLHIYLGLATAAVLAIHAPRWPNGRLETALFALFGLTWLSGVVGLYWTRTLPKRLARVGYEAIYERIAPIRGQLRDRAQAAVLEAVRTSGAKTLGVFYRDRLQGYFSQRRGWAYRLAPNSRLRKRLHAELSEAMRFFSDAERATAEELFAFIRRRDDLDYHEALQWRLRVWLFLHIALTYPLLLLGALHGWLAHLFYGGGA